MVASLVIPEHTNQTDYTQKHATYSISRFENFEFKSNPVNINEYQYPLQKSQTHNRVDQPYYQTKQSQVNQNTASLQDNESYQKQLQQEMTNESDNIQHNIKTLDFDFFTASKVISQLKAIKDIQENHAQLKHTKYESYYINQFKICQHLDGKSMYIKKIIPDNNSIFRVFSDFFTFSQNAYPTIKKVFVDYIIQNPNQFNKVLEMNSMAVSKSAETNKNEQKSGPISTNSQKENRLKNHPKTKNQVIQSYDKYLHKLGKNAYCDNEIELIMLCFIYNISLNVLFCDAQFELYQFQLNLKDSKHTIHLSMIDNSYDVCYSKTYIQKAAQVQAIIKDIIKISLTNKKKEHENNSQLSDKKMIFEEEEDIENLIPKIDVYQNDSYLKWQRFTQQISDLKDKERSILKNEQRKISKKITFLEDEKEGDEIVIRGAIKKSSLKGVHEFLNDDLMDDNNESSDQQKSRPRKNSIQLFSADDIIEEDNDDHDDSSSQDHLDNGSASSHHSLSIFPQHPFGINEHIEMNDKFQKLNIQKQQTEQIVENQNQNMRFRLSSSHDLLPSFNEILPNYEKKLPHHKAQASVNRQEVLTTNSTYNKQAPEFKPLVKQTIGEIISNNDMSNISKDSQNMSDSASYQKLKINGLRKEAYLKQINGNNSLTEDLILKNLNDSNTNSNNSPMIKNSQNFVYNYNGFSSQTPKTLYNPSNINAFPNQNDQIMFNNFQAQNPGMIQQRNAFQNSFNDSLKVQTQFPIQRETIQPFQQNEYMPNQIYTQQNQIKPQVNLMISPNVSPTLRNQMQPQYNQFQNQGTYQTIQIQPKPMGHQGQFIQSNQQFIHQPQVQMMPGHIIHQSPNVYIQGQPSMIVPQTMQMNPMLQKPMINFQGVPQGSQFQQPQVILPDHQKLSPIPPGQYSQLMPLNTSTLSHSSQFSNNSNVKITVNPQLDAQQQQTTQVITNPPPPNVQAQVDMLQQRVNGKIKFYNEAQAYGFIILPDGQEIFAHFDDLQKGNITKELLFRAKYDYTIHVSFANQESCGHHTLRY
eukprot:403343913